MDEEEIDDDVEEMTEELEEEDIVEEEDTFEEDVDENGEVYEYAPEPDSARKVGKVELCGMASKKLRKARVKKQVASPGQVFHISDDYGDVKDIYLRGKEGEVYFNSQDVSKILDALMESVADILRDGGGLALRGFGVLSLQKHKAHEIRHPTTREPITIPEHYSPKFSPGKELVVSANIYSAEMREQHAPTPDEEEQPLLPEDKVRELEEEGYAVLDF